MLKRSKFYRQIAVMFFITIPAIFLLVKFAQAQGVDAYGGQKSAIGNALGLSDEDPRVIIAKVIRVAMGFLGIIAVGLIIYAGWMWMSSQGDPSKIEKAKQILKNAVIGLVIILSAFAIASFFIGKFGGEGGSGANSNNNNNPFTFPALGNSIIESHYPARNATGIPRNTKIVITFKEAIATTSIITAGKVNSNNVKIYPNKQGESAALSDVSVTTVDNKTFVFKPTVYLGSPSEKMWYNVQLTSGILKANGQNAFGSVGYGWMFEVSTLIDVTPPQITTFYPLVGATEPKNTVVQINFNEALDPTSASGAIGGASTFNNLTVSETPPSSLVAGTFYISNQYRTVEFLTGDVCGVNSCGNKIYCLPGNKQIDVLAKAATVPANFPYNGIVDMADNSLDGNKNGSADGPATDNFSWSFNTTDQIDKTAPMVFAITPNHNETGVNLDTVPEATFNKILMSSSVNSSNVALFTSKPLNYWLSKFEVANSNKTTVQFNHDQFAEGVSYSPQFKSGIVDIHQNCYFPCDGRDAGGGFYCSVSQTAPSCCDGAPENNANCN